MSKPLLMPAQIFTLLTTDEWYEVKSISEKMHHLCEQVNIMRLKSNPISFKLNIYTQNCHLIIMFHVSLFCFVQFCNTVAFCLSSFAFRILFRMIIIFHFFRIAWSHSTFLGAFVSNLRPTLKIWTVKEEETDIGESWAFRHRSSERTHNSTLFSMRTIKFNKKFLLSLRNFVA